MEYIIQPSIIASTVAVKYRDESFLLIYLFNFILTFIQLFEGLFKTPLSHGLIIVQLALIIIVLDSIKIDYSSN